MSFAKTLLPPEALFSLNCVTGSRVGIVGWGVMLKCKPIFSAFPSLFVADIQNIQYDTFPLILSVPLCSADEQATDQQFIPRSKMVWVKKE